MTEHPEYPRNVPDEEHVRAIQSRAGVDDVTARFILDVERGDTTGDVAEVGAVTERNFRGAVETAIFVDAEGNVLDEAERHRAVGGEVIERFDDGTVLSTVFDSVVHHQQAR